MAFVSSSRSGFPKASAIDNIETEEAPMGRKMRLALSASAILAVGCGYRPPRFADLAPVTQVADDAPIAEPRATPFIEALYLSDVYVRTALVAALDPLRVPTA